MKNIKKVAEENRSFRRSVRKLFASWMKRQNGRSPSDMETIIEMLRGIEESIEIIAREIYRQGKQK